MTVDGLEGEIEQPGDLFAGESVLDHITDVYLPGGELQTGL